MNYYQRPDICNGRYIFIQIIFAQNYMFLYFLIQIQICTKHKSVSELRVSASFCYNLNSRNCIDDTKMYRYRNVQIRYTFVLNIFAQTCYKTQKFPIAQKCISFADRVFTRFSKPRSEIAFSIWKKKTQKTTQVLYLKIIVNLTSRSLLGIPQKIHTFDFFHSQELALCIVLKVVLQHVIRKLE